MAKKTTKKVFTRAEVEKVEADLRATLDALREIHLLFSEFQTDRLKLNLSAAEGRAAWLAEWALAEPRKARQRRRRDSVAESQETAKKDAKSGKIIK
jgi:hypothetical protein